MPGAPVHAAYPGAPAPAPAPYPATPAPASAAAAAPISAPVPAYVVPSSRVELKTGQVMVYGDNEVSVEEKRAKNPKYASLVSAATGGKASDGQPAQVIGKRARAADFI